MPTEDPRGYVLRPRAQAVSRGLYDPVPTPIRWQINAAGMRSDRPLAKTGRFRVLTYGDSEAFGWSVQLEDTFQHRMEALDPRVEVLNLGVPGYNAENVADHMEITAPALDPDVVIYLFHKNDFYAPFRVNPLLSRLEIYVHLRFALYALGVNDRHAWRDTNAGHRFVAEQIGRMADLCLRMDAPLIIAFLHWRYRNVLESDVLREYVFQEAESVAPFAGRGALVTNVEPIRNRYELRDEHFAEAAHRALAQRFCEILGGGGDGSCFLPSR